MGRGSSKAGGSSGGGGGGMKSSIAATPAEQGIYDLTKPTVKTIREKLSEAPDGTTIAYTQGNGDVVVFEKMGRAAFGDSWQRTVMHTDGGISTKYDTGYLINAVRDLANPKMKLKKGLTKEQRELYETQGKKLIRSYRNPY